MLARTPEVPRRRQEVARVVRVCIDVESVHQEPFESNTSEGQATGVLANASDGVFAAGRNLRVRLVVESETLTTSLLTRDAPAGTRARAPSPLASDTTLLTEADGLGVLWRQAPQVVTDGLPDGPPLRQQQASHSLGYVEDIAHASIAQIDTVDRLREFLCQADVHEVPRWCKLQRWTRRSSAGCDRPGFTAMSFAAELSRPRRKSETAMLRLVYIFGNGQRHAEYELSQ
jgi:hypothetical protein